MDIFSIFRALASLAVVLGLVGLVSYAARRWGPAGLLQVKPVSQRRMAVVESLTLGAQQRLVLVRIDDEERLIILGGGTLLHSPKKRIGTGWGDAVSGARPSADFRRAGWIALAATAASLAGPTAALAQAINLDLGTGGGLTDRVVQLVGLLTVLSLAPSIVMMTTSFVRITVVLSLLRTALGLQQSPPNAVIVSLSLFLTAIVMGPTFTQSYDAGVRPLLAHQMELPQAFGAASGPVKTFMLSQVDRDDLGLFIKLARIPKPANAQATPLTVVTPAFMISELKRAFQIGFLLFIPFLVIDLVVASVLMSMGMMMLPPVTVSLPFKLIFFVLVDGWRLVAGSLVESFRHGAGV